MKINVEKTTLKISLGGGVIPTVFSKYNYMRCLRKAMWGLRSNMKREHQRNPLWRLRGTNVAPTQAYATYITLLFYDKNSLLHSKIIH